MRMIREAVDWVAQMHETFVPPDHALWTNEEFTQWLRSTLDYGPKMVRRLCSKHLLQERIMVEVREKHDFLYELLRKNGHRVVFPDDGPLPTHTDGTLSCDLCGKAFGNAQALAMHRWKAHGIHSVERRYMHTTICRGCGKDFWTVQRCQQHLRHSKKQGTLCYRAQILLEEPPAHPQPIQPLEHMSHLHRIPAHRVRAPATIDELETREAELTAHVSQIRRHWESLGLQWQNDTPLPDLDAIVSRVWESTLDSSSDLLQTLVTAIEELAIEPDIAHWELYKWFIRNERTWQRKLRSDDEHRRWQQTWESMLEASGLQNIFQKRFKAEAKLQDLQSKEPIGYDSFPRMSHPHVDSPPACTFLKQASFDAHAKSLLLDMKCLPPIGALSWKGERHTFALHLYSGRRRSGDFHDWMVRLQATLAPGLKVHILSLDTAVSKSHGDLTSKTTLSNLHEAIRRGWVGGCLTGRARPGVPHDTNAFQTEAHSHSGTLARRGASRFFAIRSWPKCGLALSCC